MLLLAELVAVGQATGIHHSVKVLLLSSSCSGGPVVFTVKSRTIIVDSGAQ